MAATRDSAASKLTLTLPSDREIVLSTLLFASVEDRDGMLSSGMEAGAAETSDRLAEHLATMSSRER